MSSYLIPRGMKQLYLDWIKSGKKTYEGRLKIKIGEWGLHIGQYIKFVSNDSYGDNAYVIVQITELLIYPNFGAAFDELGEKLIPDKTREEVVELYDKLYSRDAINHFGVVAIGIKVVGIKIV